MWVRNQVNLKIRGSLFYQSMMNVYPIFNHSISWLAGRGIQVFAGIGPVVGLGTFFFCHWILLLLCMRKIVIY